MSKQYFIRVCRRDDDIGLLACGRDGFVHILGRFTDRKWNKYNVLVRDPAPFTTDDFKDILDEIEDMLDFESDAAFFHTSTKKMIIMEMGKKDKWVYTRKEFLEKPENDDSISQEK